MLDCVELNPDEQARASVIWLHGLGADGNDFVPIAGQLDMPVPVRYVFPHAPVRPVTINGGMAMRAWFDIAVTADGQASSSLEDVLASVKQVDQLLEREIERGIDAGKILLAGFSQGGVIALHLALRRNEPLAGVLALSTYLPHLNESRDDFNPAVRNLPIMAMHGRQDAMIPLHRARTTLQGLAALGYPFEWKEYDMPHAVCPEQVVDINTWMQQRLAP